MKKIFLLFTLLFVIITICGQTVNYALKNADGSGYVEVSALKELDNSNEATFQLWIKPEQLSGTAQLLSQDNISLELDGSKLSLKSGSQIATLNYTFALGEWAQITLVVSDGKMKAYINNVEQKEVQGELPILFTVAGANGLIAKGFKGELDEIRVWKKALTQKNFFWRNTLNKFNPDYDALIAYWKGDQELCENLVDYKFNHPGVFHNITRKAVVDNPHFAYRVSTGYTNLIRFIDRGNINRDMFLLTNDLILLSGKIQKDGSILPEYADNTALPTKVGYLQEFEGRKGIMDFQGEGAQLISQDGQVAYSAESRFGRDEASVVTLEGWFYVDSWKEGALLFSKRKDDNNCMEVRLGKEDSKEIIVDLCGTKASLKNKLEVGKWHYIGVYFAPKVVSISNTRLAFSILTISVDYKKYTALNDITLSGNDMDLGKVPALADVPIVLGKDFDGKIDELMVWAADRFNSAEHDSKNPYQLNVGNWNNIFLTAYWKGDDPDNIGKDSQSYLAMIEFMRKYYAGYRGMKIRLGIIYPDGENWKNVLNNKENVDRLIADAKKLLLHFDGIDVDLEWKNYNVLNPVIKRLITEVMEGRDDKIFSVSQHEYSHELDKSLLTDPGIDYFTMQVYGPQIFSYSWDFYQNAYNKFINYGYPKEKLLLSYGILLVDGTEEGYKDLFEKYGVNDTNYLPELNSWQCGGGMKYFNGVDQVKRKQDFIIDKGCLGTMYFDMGNDMPVSDYKSLIRAQNEVISANVDTLITKVDVNVEVGLQNVAKSTSRLFAISHQQTSHLIEIILLKDGLWTEKPVCSIYSMDGILCKQVVLSEKKSQIDLREMSKGLYLVKLEIGNENDTIKLCNY